MQIKTAAKTIGNAILDILFPRICVSCGKEGKYICEKCNIFISEAGLICPICEKSSFSGERHAICQAEYGFDGLISFWEYEGVIKKAVFGIKYRGVTHIIEEIMEKAFAAMLGDTKRFRAFLSFLLKKDLNITFVPLNIKEEKERGFNQAKEIGSAMENMINRKLVSLLEKIGQTEPQMNLNKEERIENVRDMFSCSKGTTLPQNVLLIDDIWISGATMKECAKVLKKSGIQNIWGFTLARAP